MSSNSGSSDSICRTLFLTSSLFWWLKVIRLECGFPYFSDSLTKAILIGKIFSPTSSILHKKLGLKTSLQDIPSSLTFSTAAIMTDYPSNTI
jgi:hypothetical protein